jgi:hypothetical protein
VNARIDSPLTLSGGANSAATTATTVSALSPRLRSMNTDMVDRAGAPVSRASSTAFTASPPTMVGRKRLKNMPVK